MNKIVYLLTMFAAVALLSCGQGKEEAEKNFTTPDLSLFNLHGHVSSVSTQMYGIKCCTYLTPVRLDFTEDGDLWKYSFYDCFGELVKFKFDEKSATRNNDEEYDVKRSNDGRITEMSQANPTREWGPEWESYSFKYDEAGRVDAIDYIDEGGKPNLKVTEFNEQGLPMQIKMEGYGSTVYTFDYTDYDAHGNWTSCVVDVFIPAEYDGEEDEHDSFKMSRTINYYPNPVE